jgi:hypothetical protein
LSKKFARKEATDVASDWNRSEVRLSTNRRVARIPVLATFDSSIREFCIE